MPWCDSCDRFLSPNTVRDDGTCPDCGSAIISPRSLERARRGRGSSADAMATRSERAPAPGTEADARAEPAPDATDEKTPWHFKVLLVALILYLTWRLVQGVLWVAHEL